MTIPIVPGPFSFLAELGKAGGEAFGQAEKARQQAIKEAQERLNNMISLRTAGLISPESFSGPEAMKLYHVLDIMPISSQPTPEEQKRTLMGQYLGALNQPAQKINIPLGTMGIGANQTAEIPQTARFTDEQRRVLGVPTADQLAAEQLTGAAARAQLGRVGPTELARQGAVQNVEYNAQADRIVRQLYMQTGKIPTDAEAFQAAQGDRSYQRFGPQEITQPFFGDAAERLRSDLKKEQLAAENIKAKGNREAADRWDALARVYQSSVELVQREIEQAGKKITASHQYAYTTWQEAKKKGEKVEATIEARGREYADYIAKKDRLETRQRLLQGNLTNALTERMKLEGVQPDIQPDPAQQLRDYDEMIRSLGPNGQQKADAAGIPRPPGR